MIPHWPVEDSFLAAALATLGVELDSTTPYARVIDTNNGTERTQFLFRDVSITDSTRRADVIMHAWRKGLDYIPTNAVEQSIKTALAPMLAARVSRNWLLKTIYGQPVAASQDSSETYVTPHLREAILYVSSGVPLKSFSRPLFTFPQAPRCRELLDQSLKPSGQSAPQWIDRFLTNLDRLLTFAKNTSPTLQTREGEKTLLLSADASKKTRDLFFDQL